MYKISIKYTLYSSIKKALKQINNSINFNGLLFWRHLFSNASPEQNQQKATASPHKDNPNAPWYEVAQPHEINVLGTRSPHVLAQASDAQSLLPARNLNVYDNCSNQCNNISELNLRMLTLTSNQEHKNS